MYALHHGGCGGWCARGCWVRQVGYQARCEGCGGTERSLSYVMLLLRIRAGLGAVE